MHIFFYISNIESYQSKTKYNKIAINIYVCTNETITTTKNVIGEGQKMSQ